MTGFAVGDTIRVTVNDDFGEYIAKRRLSLPQGIVGNEYLWDSDVADDGGDWLVGNGMYDEMGLLNPIAVRSILLYTRTEGTYQLKVELIASTEYDGLPTPQDFYIVKNGVGQKQDVYLRVGGQWVKQDEYIT